MARIHRARLPESLATIEKLLPRAMPHRAFRLIHRGPGEKCGLDSLLVFRESGAPFAYTGAKSYGTRDITKKVIAATGLASATSS